MRPNRGNMALDSGASCSKAPLGCPERPLHSQMGCTMVRDSARGDAANLYDCGGTSMKRLIQGAVTALCALLLATGIAAAQGKAKVSIAVGGAGCLCYL